VEAPVSRSHIFIYCDNPSHPRRVAVTNFDRIDGGLFAGWCERPASRAGDRIGTGVTMTGDIPAATGWALDAGTANATVRNKYELVCRKCRRRPQPVRAEKLHPVLDDLIEAGVSEASLALVAAMLQRRSKG